MAIFEYLVSEPPTSAELEAQALLCLSSEDVAARGLLKLVVQSEHEIPQPTNEVVLMRIRRQEYAPDGSITSILGEGTVGTETATTFDSTSIVISLNADGEQPAHARAVRS